jgi:hypothetical protein
VNVAADGLKPIEEHQVDVVAEGRVRKPKLKRNLFLIELCLENDLKVLKIYAEESLIND